jgi:hypothetical protein
MFVYGTMNGISYVLVILAPFFESTKEENCAVTSKRTATQQTLTVCPRRIIRKMVDNSRTATSHISRVRLAGGTAR